jgi:hypothetical protein
MIGRMRLPQAMATVALRPVVGAVRFGGRVVEGATLATVDVVLGSRAATEVTNRVIDSALMRHALSRALAGPLVEELSREAVRHRVLERASETVLTAEAVDVIVERVLAEGVVERSAARILEGPELERVMRTALESPAMEGLVAQVMESQLVDETVARLLESEDLWLLVEEIAQSPAVTDAITRQSMSFADQIADGFRERSRGADAWLERAAHRALRRPPPELPPEMRDQ